MDEYVLRIRLLYYAAIDLVARRAVFPPRAGKLGYIRTKSDAVATHASRNVFIVVCVPTMTNCMSEGGMVLWIGVQKTEDGGQ